MQRREGIKRTNFLSKKSMSTNLVHASWHTSLHLPTTKTRFLIQIVCMLFIVKHIYI